MKNFIFGLLAIVFLSSGAAFATVTDQQVVTLSDGTQVTIVAVPTGCDITTVKGEANIASHASPLECQDMAEAYGVAASH